MRSVCESTPFKITGIKSQKTVYVERIVVYSIGRKGLRMMNRADTERVKRMAQAAIIAALYVVLTLIFAPISFGEVQLRVAEVLTILPMFTSAAVPGLFLGCVIANMCAGAALIDVIAGSFATLIGAIGSYLLRSNRWLVPVPAILANALIVPLILQYGYGVKLPYLLLFGYIALGEIGGCYILGELFATLLIKHKDVLFKK